VRRWSGAGQSYSYAGDPADPIGLVHSRARFYATGFAPSIVTDVSIEEVANERAFVAYAAGTAYPSLEVWQYGTAGGPYLLFSYNAQTAGTTALNLFTFVTFIEQA
jgi:hypothetical protein